MKNIRNLVSILVVVLLVTACNERTRTHIITDKGLYPYIRGYCKERKHLGDFDNITEAISARDTYLGGLDVKENNQ